MNKRIFRSMSLLIVTTLAVFAALWGLSFSRQFGAEVKEGLKTLRVSIIGESGAVLFDSMADPETLGPHLSRPEVAGALENGSGESERFSDTLQQKTYYYAVRLPDGNILRLALTTASLAGLLSRFLPVLLACLLLAACLAFWTARKLTRRLVTPINNLDLDAPDLAGYDELLPLAEKIETQKRELSARLAEIESRTATITAVTANMREGLLLLDAEGRVLLANESALNILGARDAVHKTLIELCRDPAFLERAQRCLAGEKGETGLRLNGRFYSVFFNPVPEGEILGGAVVLFIDITERYAAEAQRKEFSANVSHELKTPLTAIAALSELIADGTAKEADLRPFAEKIQKQAKRLIDMIEDIIRLSEFDEGNAPREFTRFNFYDAAEAVIDSLAEKAGERGVAVELRGDPRLSVTANLRMTDELLYNLIDNAVKYNRGGGSVTVELSEDETAVRICVRDTGIGIPPEHLGRIFERFYRVDKSRSKKTGGTGLGLSIVKHVAELHGGQVSVESREGAGTAVTCTFQKPRRPQGAL